MSIIGDRIKLRRTEINLAASELADRVGISKGYLYSIENGTTQNPSAEILFNIANELQTTIADLLGEEPQIARLEQDIPIGLAEFARQEGLQEEDIKMLAGISYRGRRPETASDWRFIYESIKRTLK